MKVKMYGSHMCQETLFALMKLKDVGITVEFMNVSGALSTLREFMYLRETEPIYEELRGAESGRIGFPLMILEDGTRTLSYKEVLEKANEQKE